MASVNKQKILITIDNQFKIIDISKELSSIEFLADGAALTDDGRNADNPPDEYTYKAQRHTTIKRKGDGWTIQHGDGPQINCDAYKEIERYLKIGDRDPSYYVSKINGELYARCRPEMLSKIQGPLETEKTILMSSHDKELQGDRRIYLP